MSSTPTDAFVDAIAAEVVRRLQTMLSASPAERPRVLDVRAAAAYLGRTEAGVREMVRTGKLRPVRLDGRVFFDRQDLDAAIEAAKAVE